MAVLRGSVPTAAAGGTLALKHANDCWKLAGRLSGDAGIKEFSRGDVVFQGFHKKRSKKVKYSLEMNPAESESMLKFSPGGFVA